MTFDPKALLSRIRVPAGFVFAALYLYFSTPSQSESLDWRQSGLSLGFIIRAWATGHIRKNDELTVSGPYALTRNPLYLGSFASSAWAFDRRRQSHHPRLVPGLLRRHLCSCDAARNGLFEAKVSQRV